MNTKLLSGALILLSYLVVPCALAQLSFTAMVGYGSSYANYEAVDSETREAPASLALHVELYRLPARFIRLGAMHARAVSIVPFSSGLTYTLATFRTYVVGMGPEPTATTGPLTFRIAGISAYILTGVGLSQGFVAATTSFGAAAVGGVGVDWSFLGSIFWRTEAAYYKSFYLTDNHMFSVTSGFGFLL